MANTDAQNQAIENALGRTTQYLNQSGVSNAPVVETLVSGTAFQVNATRESDLYINVVTVAALAIQIGPDNTTGITLMASESAAIGIQHVKLPAGWFIKVTGTIANLAVTAILR